MKDGFDDLDLRLYPNPAKQELNVQLKEKTIKELKVFDLNGELLQKMIQSNKAELNLKGFANGFYSIRIETGNEVIVRKIVISN
ncbi:T9SS type A sorting domain-containing protein [Xanthovirga aplysinae]|uniref:T9SS type A sorting domain-containing protein n=1 Tax=Xanthovirga aplysinae TaxID=2529853 RepID=UPI0012BCB0BB|nr:T9SS type A sorting domain-containing protein [Xanthovirga aplysinae]